MSLIDKLVIEIDANPGKALNAATTLETKLAALETKAANFGKALNGISLTDLKSELASLEVKPDTSGFQAALEGVEPTIKVKVDVTSMQASIDEGGPYTVELKPNLTALRNTLTDAAAFAVPLKVKGASLRNSVKEDLKGTAQSVAVTGTGLAESVGTALTGKSFQIEVDKTYLAEQIDDALKTATGIDVPITANGLVTQLDEALKGTRKLFVEAEITNIEALDAQLAGTRNLDVNIDTLLADLNSVFTALEAPVEVTGRLQTLELPDDLPETVIDGFVNETLFKQSVEAVKGSRIVVVANKTKLTESIKGVGPVEVEVTPTVVGTFDLPLDPATFKTTVQAALNDVQLPASAWDGLVEAVEKAAQTIQAALDAAPKAPKTTTKKKAKKATVKETTQPTEETISVKLVVTENQITAELAKAVESFDTDLAEALRARVITVTANVTAAKAPIDALTDTPVDLPITGTFKWNAKAKPPTSKTMKVSGNATELKEAIKAITDETYTVTPSPNVTALQTALADLNELVTVTPSLGGDTSGLSTELTTWFDAYTAVIRSLSLDENIDALSIPVEADATTLKTSVADVKNIKVGLTPKVTELRKAVADVSDIKVKASVNAQVLKESAEAVEVTLNAVAKVSTPEPVEGEGTQTSAQVTLEPANPEELKAAVQAILDTAPFDVAISPKGLAEALTAALKKKSFSVNLTAGTLPPELSETHDVPITLKVTQNQVAEQLVESVAKFDTDLSAALVDKTVKVTFNLTESIAALETALKDHQVVFTPPTEANLTQVQEALGELDLTIVPNFSQVADKIDLIEKTPVTVTLVASDESDISKVLDSIDPEALGASISKALTGQTLDVTTVTLPDDLPSVKLTAGVLATPLKDAVKAVNDVKLSAGVLATPLKDAVKATQVTLSVDWDALTKGASTALEAAATALTDLPTTITPTIGEVEGYEGLSTQLSGLGGLIQDGLDALTVAKLTGKLELLGPKLRTELEAAIKDLTPTVQAVEVPENLKSFEVSIGLDTTKSTIKADVDKALDGEHTVKVKATVTDEVEVTAKPLVVPPPTDATDVAVKLTNAAELTSKIDSAVAEADTVLTFTADLRNVNTSLSGLDRTLDLKGTNTSKLDVDEVVIQKLTPSSASLVALKGRIEQIPVTINIEPAEKLQADNLVEGVATLKLAELKAKKVTVTADLDEDDIRIGLTPDTTQINAQLKEERFITVKPKLVGLDSAVQDVEINNLKVTIDTAHVLKQFQQLEELATINLNTNVVGNAAQKTTAAVSEEVAENPFSGALGELFTEVEKLVSASNEQALQATAAAKASLEASEAQLAVEQKKLSDIQEMLAAQQTLSNEQLQQLESQQAKTAEQRAEVDKLNGSLSEALGKLSEAQEELVKLSQSLADANTAKATAEAEVGTAEEKNTQLENKLTLLTQQLEDSANSSDATQSELSKSIEDLKAQLETGQSDLSALRDANVKLEAELKNQKDSGTQQLEELKAQLEDSERSLSEYTKLVQDQTAEIEASRLATEELNSQLSATENALAEAQKEPEVTPEEKKQLEVEEVVAPPITDVEANKEPEPLTIDTSELEARLAEVANEIKELENTERPDKPLPPESRKAVEDDIDADFRAEMIESTNKAFAAEIEEAEASIVEFTKTLNKANKDGSKAKREKTKEKHAATAQDAQTKIDAAKQVIAELTSKLDTFVEKSELSGTTKGNRTKIETKRDKFKAEFNKGQDRALHAIEELDQKSLELAQTYDNLQQEIEQLKASAETPVVAEPTQVTQDEPQQVEASEPDSSSTDALDIDGAVNELEQRIKSTILEVSREDFADVASAAKIGAKDTKAAGEKAYSKIEKAVADDLEQLAKAITVQNLDAGTFDSENLGTLVKKKLNKLIKDALKELENVETVAKTAKTKKTRVANFTTGAKTNSADGAEQAAKNVTDGLKAGTDPSIAADLGYELGTTIIEYINKGTDSHSPSNESIKSFKNVTDGLLVGEAKYSPEVLKAALQLGEDIVDGIDDGTKKPGLVAKQAMEEVEKKIKALNSTELDFSEKVGELRKLSATLQQVGSSLSDVGVDIAKEGDLDPKRFKVLQIAAAELYSELKQQKGQINVDDYRDLQNELKRTANQYEKLTKTIKKRQIQARAEVAKATEGKSQNRKADSEVALGKQRAAVENKALAVTKQTAATKRKILSIEKKHSAEMKRQQKFTNDFNKANSKALVPFGQQATQSTARELTNVSNRREQSKRGIASIDFDSGIKAAVRKEQADLDTLYQLHDAKLKKVDASNKRHWAQQLQGLEKYLQQVQAKEKRATKAHIAEIERRAKVLRDRLAKAQIDQPKTGIQDNPIEETDEAVNPEPRGRRLNARAVTGGIQSIIGLGSGDASSLVFGLGNLLPEVLEGLQDMRESIKSTADVAKLLKVALPLAFVAGAAALVPFVLQVEQLSTRFAAVGLSAEAEMVKIKKTANDLKVDIASLANLKIKVEASFIGLDSDVDVDEVVKNVGTIGRAYGLDTETQGRFSTGVTQAFSKGTLSMEEVKQQISEAVPGVMSAIAAAMNTSVEQAMKDIASGTVQSDVLADALAIQAERVKGGVEAGKNTTSASFQDLQNQLFEMSQRAVVPLSGALKLFLGSITNLLKAVDALMPVIISLGVVLAGQTALHWTTTASFTALKVAAVNAAISLKGVATTNVGSMSKFGKALGLLGVAAGGATLLMKLLAKELPVMSSSTRKFLEDFEKRSQPGEEEKVGKRGGTKDAVKNAVDSTIKFAETWSPVMKGLNHVGIKFSKYEDIHTRDLTKDVEEQAAVRQTAVTDSVKVDFDITDAKEVAGQLKTIRTQIKGLESQKLALETSGGTKAEIKAVDDQLMGLQKQAEQVSLTKLGFKSIGELEERLKDAQRLVVETQAIIDDSTTSDEAKVAAENRLASEQAVVRVLENQVDLISQQVKLAELKTDYEKAIGRSEDRDFALDVDTSRANQKINELEGEFNRLPSEISQMKADVNTQEALGKLENLQLKASQVGRAINGADSAKGLQELLGVADLTTASFEDIAEAEAKLGTTTNDSVKPMQELLERVKEHKNTQQDVVKQQEEYSGAVLDSKKAAEELKNTLRDILELTQKIETSFEAISFELELDDLQAELELEASLTLDGDALGDAQDNNTIESQQRLRGAQEDYRDRLLSTVDSLTQVEQEMLRTMLQGTSLAQASYQKIAQAINDIENQKARGGGFNANVENALQAGLSSKKADRDILKTQVEEQRARKSQFQRQQARDKKARDAAKKRAEEIKSFSREFRDFGKDMAKNIRDLVENIQDLIEGIEEQIADINRDTRDLTREFNGKQIVNRFRKQMGAAYKNSPIKTLLESSFTLLDGIADARDEGDDISKDIDKKLKDVHKKRRDIVEDSQEKILDLQEKYNDMHQKFNESAIESGDLLGTESPELRDAEGERLTNKYNSGEPLDLQESRKLAALYVAAGDNIESLPKDLKIHALGVQQAAKERELINQQMQSIDGQFVQLNQQTAASLASVDGNIKKLETASGRLKNAAALNQAQTWQNLVQNFSDSLEELVQTTKETVQGFQNQLDTFRFSMRDFIRQGQGVSVDQQQREAEEKLEFDFRGLTQEFDKIEQTFKGITKSFDLQSQDGKQKARADIEKFLFNNNLSTPQNRKDIDAIFNKSYDSIEEQANALAGLTDLVEALRPGMGDLVKATINVRKQFEKVKLQNEVNVAGKEKDLRNTQAANPYVSGTFYGQALGAQNEIDYRESTKGARRTLFTQENSEAFGGDDNAADYFDRLEAADMSNLIAQTQVLGTELANIATESLSTLFTDLIEGSKSAGEAFKDFAVGIAKSVVQLGAQLLAQAIVFQIVKAAGVPIPTSFGGEQGSGKIGLFGFSQGGEVGSDGIYSASLKEAIMKEGSGAQVVVAHKGEQMLSAKTGDAQLFQRIQDSGVWDQLKQGNGYYTNGGKVGSSTNAPIRAYRPSQNSGTNVVINTTENYPAIVDNRSFHRSRNQRLAQRKADMNKATRGAFAPQ